MTKQLKTSVTINASREQVWKILMEFEHYPQWNSFITSISGNVEVGKNIEIHLQGMTFKPMVTSLKEHAEFKWLGHLWFKGLFDGEHKFTLTENPDGTTLFEQSENFNGILVKLFSKNLDKNTLTGFEQMNQELKLRAEGVTSKLTRKLSSSIS